MPQPTQYASITALSVISDSYGTIRRPAFHSLVIETMLHKTTRPTIIIITVIIIISDYEDCRRLKKRQDIVNCAIFAISLPLPLKLVD